MKFNRNGTTEKSGRKFRKFIIKFKPPSPTKRPPNVLCHPWEEQALEQSMIKIYDYRSKALHEGIPFPAPMCDPPFFDESWDAPAEKPLGLGAQTMGGSWVVEDLPMLLHTFEYIVRQVLLKWWAEEAT